MNTRSLLALLFCCVAVSPALAFPPAPHHTIYGMVRDELGRPLNNGEGTIILNGATAEIVRSKSDPSLGLGVNYSLAVPMDKTLRRACPMTLMVTCMALPSMAGRAISAPSFVLRPMGQATRPFMPSRGDRQMGNILE